MCDVILSGVLSDVDSHSTSGSCLEVFVLFWRQPDFEVHFYFVAQASLLAVIFPPQCQDVRAMRTAIVRLTVSTCLTSMGVRG